MKNLVLLCFVLFQLFDGWATIHGVSIAGPSAEGNPILRFFLERYDLVLVIFAAKALAVVAGAALYATDRHYALRVATLFYLVFAVLPWIYVLA